MLRSASDVAPAAFLGGICLCVPSFTEWTDSSGTSFPGLLDHMQDRFGKGSFDVGKEKTMFHTLIASGCALGNDLKMLFDQLQHEVHGPSAGTACATLARFVTVPKERESLTDLLPNALNMSSPKNGRTRATKRLGQRSCATSDTIVSQ